MRFTIIVFSLLVIAGILGYALAIWFLMKAAGVFVW